MSEATKTRLFLSYYKPYKRLLFLDVSASLAAAALGLVFPMLIRYITKDLLASGLVDISAGIWTTGAVMLAVVALQTALKVFYDYKGHDMGAKMERDMRGELFARYQQLPLGFFDGRKTGELMSRLTNDLLNLAELLHHLPENLAVYGTQFVGAFIILMRINARLTLVICSVLPVMAAFSFFFYGRLRRSYAKSRAAIAEINACAEENLSGVRVVKSFSNEALEIRKFAAENTRFYQNRAAIYRDEALHFSVIEGFFAPFITIAISVVGGLWIAGGSLAPADLLVFILYSAYLIGPVPKLAFMVQQYQEGLTGYRRFREIMDTPAEAPEADRAAELPIAKGQIEFRGVTFRYSQEQECVLRNINLVIRGGETAAIVGSSGVGKTTLCALIPRFYETLGGHILIDGTDIKTAALDSLRRQIGVVGQETFLFAGTVRENILYGSPGAADQDVVEAAKKAGAHDFITRLPNGYNTQIGQRGVKLSGGQRQRLSIARVFLKNPPILILDEATSSLDYESERMVMESLSELAKGRTTLIIAHRLSTVRNAGRIIVLTDDGVAEQGTHHELISLNGAYSKLYNAQ